MVPGATAAGPVLTVPAVSGFLARASAPATLFREVRRQVQGFRVTLWCPTPDLRDATASLVDGALAEYDGTFIPLPDGPANPTETEGFSGRSPKPKVWGGGGGLLKYAGTFPDDSTQKTGLYRRDLRFTVEYPTIQTMQAPQVIFGIQVAEATGASRKWPLAISRGSGLTLVQ